MPPLNADAAAELRKLRAEIAGMRRVHVRHGWLKLFIKDLESNAVTQYKVHMWFVRFWIVNIAAVLLAYNFANPVWQRISVLYLVVVSLYANLATDYGAASAAMAAGGLPGPLPEIPLSPHVDADG